MHATPPFPRLFSESQERPYAIFVTCYMTGSTEGRNLGIAGYSHDFVARLFAPLLQRFGEVQAVRKEELDEAVQKAQDRGLSPIHFSVLPLQDVYLSKVAPNVVVPAWEFPDVPDHGFDDNPQNDWPATADCCDLVLVSGPFTEGALRRGGTSAPIRIVPVPTPDEYFQIEPWRPQQQRTVDCRAFFFPQPAPKWKPPAKSPFRLVRQVLQSLKWMGKAVERTVRHALKTWFGGGLYASMSGYLRTRRTQRERDAEMAAAVPRPINLPYKSVPTLELSGVVYTTIFNPIDGRKNWRDLLTGFLLALGDREDATLVVKLITRCPKAVDQVLKCYRACDLSHRCKIVFIWDFLSEEQMRQLAAATTFYVQTTKAEGNCLPLMNYLAAGRPGISPNHSSMSDYFDSSQGFVIDSHQEPSAWPHDPQLRIRTTWGRIVWTSLCDQLRASYQLATEDSAGYAKLSQRCRSKMRSWASNDAVWARLRSALEELTENRLEEEGDPADSEPAILKLRAA